MNKKIQKLAKAFNITENEVIACWKNRLKYEEQKNALSGKILCDWGFEDLGGTHCFLCNDALSALDDEWDICNVCWINRRVKENEKIYKK